MKTLKNMSKTSKTNFATYGMVVAAFVILQVLGSVNALSPTLKGQLVPICAYVVMALSLNLTVGVLGELSVSHVIILTVAVCVVIMVCLTLFTGKTKMGKAMRACSEDKAAAQLMGINVNATISMTFAIGSALAAIAGVLFTSAYPTLQPTTGALPGIKAFTAAVFGGIGSIPGAMLGGILLGVIETFAKGYISTQVSDAIVFSVLIVILLVKPAGLLGKYVPEKV